MSWNGPGGPGDLLLADADASAAWQAVADVRLPVRADRRVAIARVVLSCVESLRCRIDVG
ncbi:hypothetical protein ACTG9Q_23345 [Actinokineospora sp. 24-640]